MISLFRKFLFNKSWKILTIIVLLQICQCTLNLFLPNFNADLINNGVIKGDLDYITNTGTIMVLFALAQVLTNVGAIYLATRITYRFGADTRRKLFSSILNLSMREVSALGPGSLVTRGTNDITQVQNTTFFLLTMIIGSPISFIGGVIMAYHEAPPLMPIIGGVVLTLIIIAVLFSRAVMPIFRNVQKTIDKLNTTIREQIGGVRVIRSFTRERDEVHRFEKINKKLLSLQLSAGHYMVVMWPLVWLVANLASVCVIWLGSYQVDNGSIQVGSLTAFLAYIMTVLFAVITSVMAFIMVPRAQVSAKRIDEVLKAKTDVVDSENPVEPTDDATNKTAKGEICFNNVTFRYPNAEDAVLQNISFNAKPGKTIAIIGSTGSGKSTISRLIARLFDPVEGEITFDGINLKDIPLDSLPKYIGVIPQKAFLFTGTIRSNLLFGNPYANDEQMWEALEIAQAADFVREKKGGLDEPVSQGGQNFSGGQRQRLSIARTIINRVAKVYVLDDPFSALDYATDKALRKALEPVIANATVFLITQRVSTVANADQIIVLNNGQVQGIGSHKELLKTCEVYREIVESQGYEKGGE